MRTRQWGTGTCLLAAITLGGCDSGRPLAVNDPGPHGSVEIDLRALQGPLSQGTQETCASVIAQGVLRVSSQGGTPPELRKDIPAGSATIRFDAIQVEQGPVQFSADILSNNGTVLYDGNTSAQIDAATFSMPLTLEKRKPVLQVCPDHVTLDPSHSFALAVSNRGIGVLTYQVALPACETGPCIGLATRPEDVPAGGSTVFRAGLLRTAPQASVELRLQSPEGVVPVVVPLPKLPDLVIESAEIGGPEFTEEGNVELPIFVQIRNDGNVAAGPFKLAATYAQGKEPFFLVAPFVVPGQKSMIYPATNAPLDPGGVVSFQGNILFLSARNTVITLRIETDSCSGEELTPDYCHVNEFNEANNFSDDIVTSLP